MKNTDKNTDINIILYCEGCGNITKECNISFQELLDNDFKIAMTLPNCPNCIKKAVKRGESKGYKKGVKHTQQRHAAEL